MRTALGSNPASSKAVAVAADPGCGSELGGGFDPGDSYSIEVGAHYGLTPWTEIFAEFTPYAEVDRAGTDARGAGDLTLGVLSRFADGTPTRPSLALELSSKLAVGDDDEDLSSGETDFALALIATHPLDALVLSASYQLGWLGGGGADGEVLHAGALSLAHTLRPRLAAFAELELEHLPESAETTGATNLGLAWSWSERLLFDVVTRVGLDDDVPDLEVQAGWAFTL